MATLNLVMGFMAAEFTQMDSIWGKHWIKIGKTPQDEPHSCLWIHKQAIPGMRLKWNHLQGEVFVHYEAFLEIGLLKWKVSLKNEDKSLYLFLKEMTLNSYVQLKNLK